MVEVDDVGAVEPSTINEEVTINPGISYDKFDVAPAGLKWPDAVDHSWLIEEVKIGGKAAWEKYFCCNFEGNGGELFPLLGGGTIPWAVAEIAYREYVERFGSSQTLERLAERGGFSEGEMDMLYPDWREKRG